MKRVHPSQAQSAHARSVGAPNGLSKSGSDERRRTPRSAAGLALALSAVGVGLLCPERGNATVPVMAGEFSKSYAEHYVAPGDTIWSIAKQYGVAPEELVALNQLNMKAALAPGDVLRVPVMVEKAAPVEVAEPPQFDKTPLAAVEIDPAPEKLRVEEEVEAVAPIERQPASDIATPATEGETLAPLAATSAVDGAVEEAVTAEERPSDRAAKPKAEPADTNQVRRVASGETLYDIAAEYDISVDDLARANRLEDPNFVRAGQSLIVPEIEVEDADVPTIVGWGIEPAHRDRQPTAEMDVPNLVWVDPKTLGQQEPSLSADRPEDVPTIAALNTEVAAEPEATANETIESHYGAQLRTNVTKVRNRYASLSDRPRYASTVETAEQTSVRQTQASLARLNPELMDAGREEEEPIAIRDRRSNEETAEIAAAPRPASQQLMATGPSGVGIDTTLPRTVSPELPVLPNDPHRFLPESPGLPDRPIENVPVREKPEFNGYIWPARGTLTSGYGWRWGRMHKGIDIAGPTGTPIVAAAPGVVTYSRWNPGGYGNLVELTHPDGSQTLYAHNSRLLVREGESVTQGQQIAEMGSTGFSTGPHLHFEIHPSGQGAVNPMALLP